MSAADERLGLALRNSRLLRLLAVGALALLLKIPIAMIGNLVEERQSRRNQAVEEVASKWGRPQAITGPALVVPYIQRWNETIDGKILERQATRSAIFLPETLSAQARLACETRKRGIFSVPVYRLGLEVRGEFAAPDFSALGLPTDEILWQRAHLVVGLSDPRAIQREVALDWSGRRIAFLPGSESFDAAGAGIHAPVGASGALQKTRFSFPLELQGSTSLYFTPFGKNTQVEIAAQQGQPSFQGNWLPASHRIDRSGFSARWEIPYLGRGYPQAWENEAHDLKQAIEASRFGFVLIEAVDHYRMAERSVKYAGLFIVLTFAAIWLIEVLAGVRVHPIQYLLLGGALCLFYLLELSLSEHIGFPSAYAVACCAVLAMATAYSKAVLHRVGRVLVVFGAIGTLYSYLYVLLMNENYALITGSIGLFLILGGIMYATRRVDWYAADPSTPTD